MAITQRPVIPIIDSHVHLYPDSETSTMTWISQDHPLSGQHSVDQYREATKASGPSLLGFVVVEANREHDLESGQADGSGWHAPLQETSWLRRVALGEPRPGEGHGPQDSKMCLGIIPWAPIPSGPAVVERYLGQAREASGSAWPKVRGFRYLLQDKPCQTATRCEFVESLKLLGRRGLLFELCVDYHRRGQSQLDDAAALVALSRASVSDVDQVTIVIGELSMKLIPSSPADQSIDHFLKPDLTHPARPSDPSFEAWAAAIAAMASFPKTYIKLSGAFSETSDAIRSQDPLRVAEFLQPWFTVILDAFGPRRMLFGSDWPVCTVGFLDDNDNAWGRWQEVVQGMCAAAGLGGKHTARIFSGTAREVYLDERC